MKLSEKGSDSRSKRTRASSSSGLTGRMSHIPLGDLVKRQDRPRHPILHDPVVDQRTPFFGFPPVDQVGVWLAWRVGGEEACGVGVG